MTLEQILKQQREKLGLRQADLAAILKLSTVQFISNNERDYSRWPAKYFPVLSEVLEVPVKRMIRLRMKDLKNEIEGEIERAQGESWKKNGAVG